MADEFMEQVIRDKLERYPGPRIWDLRDDETVPDGDYSVCQLYPSIKLRVRSGEELSLVPPVAPDDYLGQLFQEGLKSGWLFMLTLGGLVAAPDPLPSPRSPQALRALCQFIYSGLPS